jgi:hypothetical protein
VAPCAGLRIDVPDVRQPQRDARRDERRQQYPDDRDQEYTTPRPPAPTPRPTLGGGGLPWVGIVFVAFVAGETLIHGITPGLA